MYHHFIQEMARGLVEAGLTKDTEQVELLLTKYWADKIAAVWCVDDVHSIQDDFDQKTGKSSLSDDQALEILLSSFEDHDGNHGITWESLRYWSQEYLEQEIVSALPWEED